MLLDLQKKKSKIDKFYYCPFHPKGIVKKYSKNSILRKPNNGMLLKAMKKYKFKPSECFMIGDQKSDYECAKKVKLNLNIKKYSLDIQVNKILKKYYAA